MPELPEVETSRRGIAPYIEGNQLTHLQIRQSSLRYPIPIASLERLIGQTVLSVTRRGKYLLIAFEQGSLLIHLGMSGSLRILEAAQDLPLKKHDHVEFVFKNATRLRYHDPRRFGLILWAENHQHPLLDKVGMEPLCEAFTADWLYRLAQGRKTPIKPLLMTSHLITGVGNIYANESLFAAGIHPASPANQLSKTHIDQLHQQIQAILKRAIEQGGSTLKDFVNTQGEPGYFAQTLKVYGRAGQACEICGHPIEKILQSQRASFYCPSCQKPPRKPRKTP